MKSEIIPNVRQLRNFFSYNDQLVSLIKKQPGLESKGSAKAAIT